MLNTLICVGKALMWGGLQQRRYQRANKPPNAFCIEKSVSQEITYPAAFSEKPTLSQTGKHNQSCCCTDKSAHLRCTTVSINSVAGRSRCRQTVNKHARGSYCANVQNYQWWWALVMTTKIIPILSFIFREVWADGVTALLDIKEVGVVKTFACNRSVTCGKEVV